MRTSVKQSKRAGRALPVIALSLFLLAILSGAWSGKDALAGTASVAPLPRPAFDCCLQDDSSGLTLQFSSTTGLYQITDQTGAIILTGTGKVTKKGCVKTLNHVAFDRRVRGILDTCTERGNAGIQILLPAPCTLTITDRDTDDNECVIDK